MGGVTKNFHQHMPIQCRHIYWMLDLANVLPVLHNVFHRFVQKVLDFINDMRYF
jgi:hypothetical protein